MRRAPVLLAAALAGCVAGPDYAPPETTPPAAFGGAEGVANAGAAVSRWWTTFRDPVLDSLVERAVAANPDLRAASARVREARALRGLASAQALPRIDAAGGASRTRASENTSERLPDRTISLWEAGFDALWEIDVFGGAARGTEAADAEVGAAVEDRRDVLVTLLGDVARNYVELRGAQRQIAIAQANLAAQRETLSLTRLRLDAGLASELDVARARALVESTASVVPQHEARARLAVHALGALLGREPNALAAELAPERAIPAAPPEVPAGLPSELLLRRPDVRRAERRLAAATARIGAATADFFPKFSLTAALGLESEQLHELVGGDSATRSIGGAVRWPLLDFGRVASNVEAQRAREEQAFAAYESAVLRSLREVEDALVALRHERARRSSLEASVAANERAVELATQLWTAGRTDFLAVLQAQRDLFAAQDALVVSERLTASNAVALYKALGGGWQVETSIGDPDRGAPGRRAVTLSRRER